MTKQLLSLSFAVLSFMTTSFHCSSVRAQEKAAPQMKISNLDIVEFFNKFGKDNIDLADQFYDEAIVFEDPITQLQGLKNMKDYYRKMYNNVTEIRFDFDSVITQGDQQVGVWTMHLRAKGLNGGNLVSVKGNSLVKYKNGKAIYHRDYFDAGALLYEHLPILGSVIKLIKSKFH